MEKSRFTLIFLMLVLTSIVFAEERPPFPKVEDMHNRKWQYLVAKTQLSQKEADATQPIFMEYEKALWNFYSKNRDYLRALSKKIDDNDVNYSEVNDRIVETKVIEAMMFKNYHLKLKRVLAPEKLFKYYRAENEYKQTLLRTLPGGPNQNGRRPEHP